MIFDEINVTITGSVVKKPKITLPIRLVERVPIKLVHVAVGYGLTSNPEDIITWFSDQYKLEAHPIGKLQCLITNPTDENTALEIVGKLVRYMDEWNLYSIRIEM